MLEMMLAGGLPPPVLGTVVKMVTDSGNFRAFALDEDGSLYCRGSDSTQGWIGLGGSTNSIGKWTKILTNVSDFWISQQYVLIHTKDSRWFWFGRFLNTTIDAALVPTEITSQFSALPLNSLKKVAVGPYGVAILDTNNNLYTKGYNANGWLFTGNTTTQQLLLTLRTETNIRDIEMCSNSGTLYILYNGGVLKGAGDGSSGQLGPLVSNQTTLRVIASLSPAPSKIVAGSNVLWVNINGAWYYIGAHQSGQTGAGLTTGNVTTLTEQTSINGATEVVSGGLRTWAKMSDGWYFSGDRVQSSGVANLITGWQNTGRTTFGKIPISTYPIYASPGVGPTFPSSSTFVHDGNVYGCGDTTDQKLLPGFGSNTTVYGYHKLNMNYSLVE